MTKQKEIELKEAVERVKAELEFHESCNHDLRELSFGKDIHTLIDLAQRYLEIDGFPEEKEQSDLSSNPHICFENAGYNQAIQDCKLSLLNKMDGITPEFLHNEYLKTVKHLHPESFNPVANKPYDELTDEQKSIDIFIAQAIKDHLTK